MTIDLPAWTRQLSAWLAGTDIQSLELLGPNTSLRLRRGVGAAPLEAAQPTPSQPPAAGADRGVVVTAASVGVVLHGHPQRGAALAPIGTRVRTGQPIALLEIGTLLLPVPAPRDAVVTRLVAADGAIVGYGDPIVELSE